MPAGSSGMVYADILFGMTQHVPQGPAAYDIRTTPDEDIKSIPAFFDFINGLPSSMKLTWISIGTLTPIAKMFTLTYINQMEAILPRVKSLTVMGGAEFDEGNLFALPVNKKAEFNIYCDPHAAQWAFKNLSDRGVPVVLVPLDATNDVLIQEHLLTTLRFSPRTPEAQLAGRLFENLRDTWFAPDMFFSTAYLWDPSAAIAAVHESTIVKKVKRQMRVVIEEGPDGPNQGWTKPCDDVEVSMGMCTEIIMIENLDGYKITEWLLRTLQSSKGSAMRGLVCL